MMNEMPPSDDQAKRVFSIIERVSPAPPWLMDRMKGLRQMPPPTLQEVETSFRAAEEMRSNYDGSPSCSGNGHEKSSA
ncbi:MAG: hypothetical protein C5B50_26595 [Verrucomicrobia bacterium]|nr:MAG: hypothetical protein C5B50_26595 [Verrucomicrobiota bacterium]